jgi:hypothetical protein
MCQKCYKRGYDDFPGWVGSAVHPDSYEEGFADRGKELNQDPGELTPRDFCQKCYDRGKNDFYHNIWTPPETDVRGHYSSYKDGYNFQEKNLEFERSERIKEESLKKSTPTYVNPVDNDWVEPLIKVAVVIALVVGAIWLAVNVILPLLILNIGIIALALVFLVKEYRREFCLLSIFACVYFVVDFNVGWLTKSLLENVSFPLDALKIILYLNMSAGFVCLYLLIRNAFNSIYGISNNSSEFSKRNLIIMASLLLIAGSSIGYQVYSSGGGNSYNGDETDDVGVPTGADAGIPPIEAPAGTPVLANDFITSYIKHHFEIERDKKNFPEPKTKKVFLLDYNSDGLMDGVAYGTYHRGNQPRLNGFALYKNVNGKLAVVDEVASEITNFKNVTQADKAVIVNALTFAPKDESCCPSIKTKMIVYFANDKIMGLK